MHLHLNMIVQCTTALIWSMYSTCVFRFSFCTSTHQKSWVLLVHVPAVLTTTSIKPILNRKCSQEFGSDNIHELLLRKQYNSFDSGHNIVLWLKKKKFHIRTQHLLLHLTSEWTAQMRALGAVFDSGGAQLFSAVWTRRPIMKAVACGVLS